MFQLVHLHYIYQILAPTKDVKIALIAVIISFNQLVSYFRPFLNNIPSQNVWTNVNHDAVRFHKWPLMVLTTVMAFLDILRMLVISLLQILQFLLLPDDLTDHLTHREETSEPCFMEILSLFHYSSQALFTIIAFTK